MRLVEDDGEVIDQLTDDTALIVLYPNRELGLIVQKMAGDTVVPEHIQLAAALLVFLKDRDNVREVLRHLPRKRDPDYKAN